MLCRCYRQFIPIADRLHAEEFLMSLSYVNIGSKKATNLSNIGNNSAILNGLMVLICIMLHYVLTVFSE